MQHMHTVPNCIVQLFHCDTHAETGEHRLRITYQVPVVATYAHPELPLPGVILNPHPQEQPFLH